MSSAALKTNLPYFIVNYNEFVVNYNEFVVTLITCV